MKPSEPLDKAQRREFSSAKRPRACLGRPTRSRQAQERDASDRDTLRCTHPQIRGWTADGDLSLRWADIPPRRFLLCFVREKIE